MNSSATGASTTNRLAQTQLWPELVKRAPTAAAAAAGTSASASTTNASDPPSSSTDRLDARPAAAPTISPARLLPVRVTAAIRSSAIRPPTVSGTSASSMTRVVTRWAGKPTCSKASARASAVPVTLGECLSSTPLPAASVGMANRMTCQTGKFQGITASTRPIGSGGTNAETPAGESISTGRAARMVAALAA